jgi:sulfite exporter TauE/SafE
MRRVFLFVVLTAIFAAVTSAQAVEASCEFRKCMSICRSDNESGCAGMCGRIVSLCKQLVPKSERMRNARRSNSAHEPVEVDGRAQSPSAERTIRDRRL